VSIRGHWTNDRNAGARSAEPEGRSVRGVHEQIVTEEPAEPLEGQLVEWISDFRPDEELRATILASIRTAARDSNDDSLRRRELSWKDRP
jgi:hypothetical protein